VAPLALIVVLFAPDLVSRVGIAFAPTPRLCPATPRKQLLTH